MADIDNNQNAENTQLPAEFNDSTDMNLADMLSALIESTIAADQKAVCVGTCERFERTRTAEDGRLRDDRL